MTRNELLQQDEQRFREERMKKAVVSYPPRWATIAISSRCTNRCIFCSYHSLDARKGKSNVYNMTYKMPLEHFKKQVDMFHAGRIPHVHICATGDPFLHDNILDMIDYVIAVYGKCSFQSNFNESIMKRGDYVEHILQRSQDIKYIVSDVHAGEGELFGSIKRGSDFNNLLAVLKEFQKKDIHLIGSFILTRQNYQSLHELLRVLLSNEITMQVNVVNLFAHMFNDFTSIDNVYRMEDTHITASLKQAQKYAQQHGLVVNLPRAFDDPDNVCSVFWDKVQVWPVAGIDEQRYDENLISHACNAVVRGDINSLGYVFDYENVMDFWNNDIIVGYRQKILDGVYPDRFCWSCADGASLCPAENNFVNNSNELHRYAEGGC